MYLLTFQFKFKMPGYFKNPNLYNPEKIIDYYGVTFSAQDKHCGQGV
jgi:hypothetical protein